MLDSVVLVRGLQSYLADPTAGSLCERAFSLAAPTDM